MGHACFRLHSSDMVVLTDPFPLSLGMRPDARPASVVTVSNSHPNHSNSEEVSGDPKVFSAPGEYEYLGVTVKGVMTPLAPETPQEQRNVAYSVEIDGIKICHLGDISSPLTSKQVDELSPVDVLMVPTGGGCTLDLDQVMQAIQDLNPKIVIPMHHGSPEAESGLQQVGAFLGRLGLTDTQPVPRVVVTASNLPDDRRIVVLTAQARPA